MSQRWEWVPKPVAAKADVEVSSEDALMERGSCGRKGWVTHWPAQAHLSMCLLPGLILPGKGLK